MVAFEHSSWWMISNIKYFIDTIGLITPPGPYLLGVCVKWALSKGIDCDEYIDAKVDGFMLNLSSEESKALIAFLINSFRSLSLADESNRVSSLNYGNVKSKRVWNCETSPLQFIFVLHSLDSVTMITLFDW